ncbi:MAG: PAS domain-containing protein [Proteobacteria bacterium]|nr:PAS domain-containing protein [Pseudomonadota bacterium]
MPRHQSGLRRVSSADLVRNPALWQERALDGPVIITYHGRDRLVLGPIEDVKKASSQVQSHLALEYRLIKAHVAEVYAVLDQDLRFVEVNRNTCEFFQRAEGELIGAKLSSLYPEYNYSTLLARVQRVHETGEADRFEAESVTHPGRYFAFTIYRHPLGAAILAVNVTEKHMLAHQLSILSALSRAAEQIRKVASVRLDSHSRIVLCGGAFHDWTGFTPEDLLHNNVTSIVCTEHRSAVADDVVAVMETQRVVRTDACFVSKSGQSIAVQLAMAPIVEEFDVTGVAIVATKVDLR